MSAAAQHSALGASSAFRWLACPGSVRMSDGVADSGEQSPYAAEGTKAHEYAESVVTGGDPIKDIPEEMSEYVQIYTKLVQEFQKICDWHEVEHQFDLGPLNPPVDAYGTADFVGYTSKDHALIVADLKYGTGVVVEVEGNSQLMYYALGALLSFQQVQLDAGDPPVRIDKVRLVIVQPRAYHPDGHVREAVINIEDLMEFSITLIDAMHETQKPDAELIAGKHCRWCRAAAICPALLAFNQDIAQTEFAELPADEDILALAANPVSMSNDDVGHLLYRLDAIEHWINSVRMYAQNELERGRPVQGWKLVAKQARRKWADENAAYNWLFIEQKMQTENIMDSKLKSPAQIEKLITVDIPSEHIIKKSTGNKIAREASPLPEITMGSEFFNE